MLLFYFYKNGRYLLADPMLAERASPFNFMGPQRFSTPPILAEDLPELEAVVISHDHYDHLDYETIQKITAKTKILLRPNRCESKFGILGSTCRKDKRI